MLGIRVDPETERAIAALAKRQGRTKSAVVREAIRHYLTSIDLAEEARRQSLAVSQDATEQDAVGFVEHASDLGDAQ